MPPDSLCRMHLALICVAKWEHEWILDTSSVGGAVIAGSRGDEMFGLFDRLLL